MRTRRFNSISVTEAGRERTLVPGTHVELYFTQPGRLTAYVGCNTLTVSSRLDINRLTEVTLASTKKACREELSAQDAWLSQVFDRGPTFLDGSPLELRSGDVVVEFLVDLSPS